MHLLFSGRDTSDLFRWVYPDRREQGCLRGRHAVAASWSSQGRFFLCFARNLRRVAAKSIRNEPTYVPDGGVSHQIRSLTGGEWLWFQVVGAEGMIASLPLGSKLCPVLSMVCMMTASLRATPMAARLKPRRARSCNPQSLRRL